MPALTAPPPATPPPPSRARDLLRQSYGLLQALAVLAILVVASLAHGVLVTTWRQRRELIVLRAVGLTPGQIATAGAARRATRPRAVADLRAE